MSTSSTHVLEKLRPSCKLPRALVFQIVRSVWPDGIIRTFSDQVGNDHVQIEDLAPELEDE